MTDAVATAADWPAVSLVEASARLMAPGAMFETETLELHGRSTRVWRQGPKTLCDVFEAGRAFGDRTFLVHEAERVSFEGFVRAALAFSRRLVEVGVEPGDRVAISLRNLPEWPVAFYGAVLAGAVATPLNAWWTGGELAFALEDCGATAAVFDGERLERVADRLAAMPTMRRIFTCRRGRVDAPASGEDLEETLGAPAEWAALPPGGASPALRLPEDLATLFYTSGTAGAPKGAPASNRAATTAILSTLFSQARAFVRRGETPPIALPHDAQRAYVVSIPFFHVTGCFALLNVALVTGMKLVMMRRFDPELVMSLVERERASAIGGVPTIPWQVLEHPARDRYDLSSLESVTYGGAPAAPELVRRIGQAWPGARASTGWGMTETSATFTHHVGEDYALRPDSCGPPAPVNDVRLVAADGDCPPPGGVGELWVRGPGVVAQYWNRPEADAKTFDDGWLKTGDLARIDDEGFVYIVDRLKDVVIRGGENIYSVEVEDALYAHPDVMDAAVLPIAHPTLGEEPGAVVFLKPGGRADESELQAHVRARLAAFKAPVRVVIRTEPLPRNAAGKVVKAELKSLLTVV